MSIDLNDIQELLKRYDSLRRYKNLPPLERTALERAAKQLGNNIATVDAVLAYLTFAENKPYLAAAPALYYLVTRSLNELRKIASETKTPLPLVVALYVDTLVQYEPRLSIFSTQRVDHKTLTELEKVTKRLLSTLANKPEWTHSGTSVHRLFYEFKRLLGMIRTLANSRHSRPLLPPDVARLAKLAKAAFRMVIEAASTSRPYGLVTGVRTIKSLEEIRDLVPSERALLYYSNIQPRLKPYALYRLLSGQAVVYDRTVRATPVVYIDMSGSMTDGVDIKDIGTMMKYDAAAALAIGTLEAFKRGDAILFDTELLPLDALCGQDVRCIINLLLYTIGKPMGGGTDIANVLMDILAQEKTRGRAGEKPFYIVITDADDEVPQEVIDEIKRNTDLWRRIIVLLLGDYEPEWLKQLNYLRVEDSIEARKVIAKTLEAAVAATT